MYCTSLCHSVNDRQKPGSHFDVYSNIVKYCLCTCKNSTYAAVGSLSHYGPGDIHFIQFKLPSSNYHKNTTWTKWSQAQAHAYSHTHTNICRAITMTKQPVWSSESSINHLWSWQQVVTSNSLCVCGSVHGVQPVKFCDKVQEGGQIIPCLQYVFVCRWEISLEIGKTVEIGDSKKLKLEKTHNYHIILRGLLNTNMTYADCLISDNPDAYIKSPNPPGRDFSKIFVLMFSKI